MAEFYGPTHYGSSNGSVSTIVALVQTTAPLGAGALHDLAGSYDLVVGMVLTAGVTGCDAGAESSCRARIARLGPSGSGGPSWEDLRCDR